MKISGKSVLLEKESWQTIYDQKFDGVEDGELPEDFFVLEGNFQVTTKEEGSV